MDAVILVEDKKNKKYKIKQDKGEIQILEIQILQG